MMLLGSMAALTNGASVRIWNQKPSPLVSLVFQIGTPQQGKSRLFAIAEEIFETCDDVVEEMVKEEAQTKAAEDEATPGDVDSSVTVKSITLQSFTFTEFFYACSASYPQVESKSLDLPSRLWYGNAMNLDEAYGFLDGLGLLGPRNEKDRTPSVNASTLNCLIQSGKTRRSTRTGVSYGGEGRDRHVSLSILGNGHPSKLIPMERGSVGCHTAATKERFLFCLDRAVVRHAALPDDCALPGGVTAWTWLPLTSQQAQSFGWQMYWQSPKRAEEDGLAGDDAVGEVTQADATFVGPSGGYAIQLPDGTASRLRYQVVGADALGAQLVRTEWRISSRWRLDDPTEHVRCAARRVAVLFAKKPHYVLSWEEEARKVLLGNQVVQAIRAAQNSGDSSVAALHANAAGLQGVCAALVAVLEYAGGGGKLDDQGMPIIRVEHVHLARRLVEVNLRIREAFRAPVDLGSEAEIPENAEELRQRLATPVSGAGSRGRFAAPFLSQLAPVPELDAGASGNQVPLLASDDGEGNGGDGIADRVDGSGSGSALHGSGDGGAIGRGGDDGGASLFSPAGAAHVDAGAGEDGGRLREVREDGLRALTFEDFSTQERFDEAGFGPDGAMILSLTQGSRVFRDRVLLRRVLSSGQESGCVTQIVDNWAQAAPATQTGRRGASGRGAKRARVRPSKQEVQAVLTAAFEQFPRLGAFDDGSDVTFTLKAWGEGSEAHIKYHNELMQCCLLSLSEVSAKRATFVDSRPAKRGREASSVEDAAMQSSGERADAGRQPRGSTLPLGRRVAEAPVAAPPRPCRASS